MGAKGVDAKEQITKQILQTFKGSFIADQVIRIPYEEDGEIVEIKVSLSIAKDVKGDSILHSDDAAPTSAEMELLQELTEVLKNL